MRRPSEEQIIIGLVILFAFWLFFILPLISAWTAAQYAAQYRAPSAEERSFVVRTLTDPTALFTALVFFATAVYALSTIALWYATQQGFRQQSNETRIIQRGYLSAAPHGIDPYYGTVEGVVAYVCFQNAGHLPARDFSYYLDFASEPDWKREDFPIPPPGTKGWFGKYVLAPGDNITLGTDPFKLPKTGYIYLGGEARYDDGFGQRRITRFCHRYNCAATANVRDNRQGIAAQFGRRHEYGNDAT